MNYPEAPRLDLVENLHGTDVADPYRWLEDAQDPRTITWLSAQDTLVAQACAEWSTSSHWESRLRDLMSAGAISPPIWRGERAFFMRRTAEQEHALLLTIDPDGTERV
ncbi:MAG: S9 family peptidase, partial [Actinobacteria bacterium]|nr:S9 family peptidase [Actinomycetota bacterium]